MRYVDLHWFCSSSRDGPFDLKNLLRRCFSVLYILKKNDHYFLELSLSLVITSHFSAPHYYTISKLQRYLPKGPLMMTKLTTVALFTQLLQRQAKFNEELGNAWAPCPTSRSVDPFTCRLY